MSFFRKGFLISVTTLALPMTAGAQDSDPMSAYYANTWDFREEGDFKRLHINKDKSVKIRLSDGRVFDGTWTKDGETICFHVGSESACFSDLLGRRAGTTWKGVHDGEDYTGTLSEGRQPLS